MSAPTLGMRNVMSMYGSDTISPSIRIQPGVANVAAINILRYWLLTRRSFVASAQPFAWIVIGGHRCPHRKI